MLLVGLPMLVVAAIAWLVVGVWAMLVVIVIAAAAMTFRGMTILRRAHR
jgi:hypothetical protein